MECDAFVDLCAPVGASSVERQLEVVMASCPPRWVATPRPVGHLLGRPGPRGTPLLCIIKLLVGPGAPHLQLDGRVPSVTSVTSVLSVDEAPGRLSPFHKGDIIKVKLL